MVQEIKEKLFREGIVIREGFDSNMNAIRILLLKRDTDGVDFSRNLFCYANEYYNESSYCNALQRESAIIIESIDKRHAQDINTCDHNVLPHNNVKVCSYCMGTFGLIDPNHEYHTVKLNKN